MSDTNKRRFTDKFVERYDYSLWMMLVFICCFGLIMLYSASAYECATNPDMKYDSFYLFKRQAGYMALGFLGMFGLQFVDFHLLKLKYLTAAVYLVGIGTVLLLLTPLGVEANGATRWLNIGIQFQVAELVKVTTILGLSYLIYENKKSLKTPWFVIRLWIVGGIPAMLLFFISNDLSSALIVLIITFGLSFVTTKTMKMHLCTLGVVIAGATLYVLNIARDLPTQEALDQMPFRIGRIAAWIAPERYATKQGYQVLQSLYAIGSGGFFGKGLGNGVQKMGGLPEAETDMIFSVLCEELGVFGALCLVGMYIYLLFLLYKIAVSTTSLYGSILVMGIIFHIGSQALINIAVCTNFFPNTGVPLPFISSGGTAVFILLMEMAIVLSVERRRLLIAQGKKPGKIFNKV